MATANPKLSLSHGSTGNLLETIHIAIEKRMLLNLEFPTDTGEFVKTELEVVFRELWLPGKPCVRFLTDFGLLTNMEPHGEVEWDAIIHDRLETELDDIVEKSGVVISDKDIITKAQSLIDAILVDYGISKTYEE